jgi:hypothetical protein
MVAKTFFGFENISKKIANAGRSKRGARVRMVSFKGDKVYKANLSLRTALKI